MKAPGFWNDPDSGVARLLSPLGWLYAEATARRLARDGARIVPVPVICVGNVVAGGAGKTPVVRDLAARLMSLGRRSHVLSRGYGGRLRGPLRVDPARHRATDVGDEALLLAGDAPSWISADRAAGASAIVAAGADVVIMDDGLQNPALHQDLRLIVADGETGFGNGRCIPAGPLRERIAAAIARAHALIVIGRDRTGLTASFAGRLPVLPARLEPADTASIAGVRTVAFAGIGRPEKFRATLAEAGADILLFRSFGDHHDYRESELAALASEAARRGAVLTTTEKDWVRLTSDWRGRVIPVPVRIRWRDEPAVTALLDGLFARG